MNIPKKVTNQKNPKKLSSVKIAKKLSLKGISRDTLKEDIKMNQKIIPVTFVKCNLHQKIPKTSM